MQLVPKGVPGELYLGGEGLARGYLNRPDLTSAKFITNPFHNTTDRLYQTGDLVRYLDEGDLEYLGRLDNQVKIRGFRIELGEIEAALSKHPQVETAIVVVREDDEDKRLVAYLVADQQPAPNSSQLRAFLANHVPEYMIPADFVLLETLPLTPNGKVDRRALPAPEKNTLDTDNNLVAPRDNWEMQLVKIWQKILKTDAIGVKDDFFALGDHSLLAVSLMAEIKQQFGQTLPLTMLFQKNTIEQLAPDLDPMEFYPLVEVFQHNLQALQNYIPQKYPGEITFFQAQEKLWENLPNSSLDWHQLSSQELDIYPMEGNHYTILSVPYVSQLAAKLKCFINIT